MKQLLVEMVKKTNLYKMLRSFFYETKINNYQAELIDAVETNTYITSLINDNKPFMISRFGSNELSVLKKKIKNKKYSQKQKIVMQSCAGFYPASDNNLDDFCQLYFNAILSIDLLGIWMNPFEDVIANKFCANACLTKLRNLEPYFTTTPWSLALKNKRVLVIHPFNKSIKKQYKKRELLFKNKDVLPEFNLITYQAVQSLGGESDKYTSWFDALKGMQTDILTIDFDIAIIGAGAYGLPLASFIKGMGKSAIHLGGATQLLFGIYGRRWEKNPKFKKLINEHWVRPSENEKPKQANKIENGCYW